jgi:hypothetical protein
MGYNNTNETKNILKKKYQENYTFQTTKTNLCYVSYYKPRILKSEDIVKKQRQTRGQKIMVHKIINRNIFSCLLYCLFFHLQLLITFVLL